MSGNVDNDSSNDKNKYLYDTRNLCHNYDCKYNIFQPAYFELILYFSDLAIICRYEFHDLVFQSRL